MLIISDTLWLACSLYSSALVYFADSQRVCFYANHALSWLLSGWSGISSSSRISSVLVVDMISSRSASMRSIMSYPNSAASSVSDLVSSLQSSCLHMGMDSDTGGLAELCHGYIIVYLEFDLLTKHHHLVELGENFLQMYHLWRTDLCLVEMHSSDSYSAALAKVVLLLCRLDCYLVSWSVIDMGHWVSQVIRAAEHKMVAYWTAASECLQWVYWVLFSCGEWSCSVEGLILTNWYMIYSWCSSERSGNV